MMKEFNQPRFRCSIEKHLVCYEDPPAPNANESTQDVLEAVRKNLPGLMQAINSQVLPTAQAQLATSQAISGPQNQLALDLYKQFAPAFAQAGVGVDDITRKGTAATDVDILNTSGRQLADVYKEIDQKLNPEAYAARAQAGAGLTSLLNETTSALNRPDIEAERLISQEAARSGNDIAPNATTTTANALSFADQRQKRIGNLSNAISTATQFLQPASNAQFNPATAALGKPTSNAGTAQFAGVKAPGQEAYQTGNNFLNNVSSFQNTAMGVNANRRDILDRLNETTTSIGSL